MFYERREDILSRVLTKVLVSDRGLLLDGLFSPCLEWQGGTTGDGRGGGYGKMSLNGRMVSVHIVVYTHYYGYIPPRKQIDHLCNNRLCCNLDSMLAALPSLSLLLEYLRINPTVSSKTAIKDISKMLRDEAKHSTIGVRLMNSCVHRYFMRNL